jgi:hypothetical protein
VNTLHKGDDDDDDDDNNNNNHISSSNNNNNNSNNLIALCSALCIFGLHWGIFTLFLTRNPQMFQKSRSQHHVRGARIVT